MAGGEEEKGGRGEEIANGKEKMAGGGEELAGEEEKLAGGGEKLAGGELSKSRKRVETTPAAAAAGPSIVRGKDGSGFTRCEKCGKSVPAALIRMHGCSIDAKVRKQLESQTVQRQIKDRKAVRRRSATKKDKNPNSPKQSANSFFVFMDEFRKLYKEANPDSKYGVEVTKEGAHKWKSLTEEEKKPYKDKAAELKAKYAKVREIQNAQNEEDEKEIKEEVVEKKIEEIKEEVVEKKIEEIRDEE